MTHDLDNIRAEKKALRQRMRLLRAALAAQQPGGADKLRDVFLANVDLPPDSCVAITMAQPSEIDPMPLGLALLAAGHRLCLPAVASKDAPLIFRTWTPGDPLKAGAWKIPEPLVSSPAVIPTVLLVPLLAFDRHGNRLGQGGGFYDRTLAALRSQSSLLAIGLGYAAQEVPYVPITQEDAQLDAVITEEKVIHMESP